MTCLQVSSDCYKLRQEIMVEVENGKLPLMSLCDDLTTRFVEEHEKRIIRLYVD